MTDLKQKKGEMAKKMPNEKYKVIRFYSPDHGGGKRVMKRGLSLDEARKNAESNGSEHSKGRYFHGFDLDK